MAEAVRTMEPDPHGGCPDAGCSPSCPARIYPTIGDDGSVSYDPVERRATVAEAIEAWEEKGPTSLTVALMADALYGVREEQEKVRKGEEWLKAARDKARTEPENPLGGRRVVPYTHDDAERASGGKPGQ